MSLEYTGWVPQGGVHQYWSAHDPNRYNARREATTEAWAEGIASLGKPIREEPIENNVTTINEDTGQRETQARPRYSLWDDLFAVLGARNNQATNVDITE
jgi:hypothetical protein